MNICIKNIIIKKFIMKKTLFFSILLIVSALTVQLSVQGAVYYVDPDKADSNDGTSWENAFKTVQGALTTLGANTGTIYLKKDATFTEHSIGPTAGANVEIIGDNTTIQAFSQSSTSGARRIFRVPLSGSEVTNVKLKGLILQNGCQNGAVAGCIFIASGNLEIDSCTIKDNNSLGNSSGGGAICNRGGNLTIKNSYFKNNTAASIGGGGAILQSKTGSSIIIENTTFEGNTANIGDNTTATAATSGSAIGLYESSTNSGPSNIRIVNCTFLNNTTVNTGVGGAVGNITLMADMNATAWIVNNTFIFNRRDTDPGTGTPIERAKTVFKRNVAVRIDGSNNTLYFINNVVSGLRNVISSASTTGRTIVAKNNYAVAVGPHANVTELAAETDANGNTINFVISTGDPTLENITTLDANMQLTGLAAELSTDKFPPYLPTIKTSPLVEAGLASYGDPEQVPATDQLGVVRASHDGDTGLKKDIGSFEYQATPENCIWNGNTSSLWTEAGNWADGTIPSLFDNVTFAVAVENYPVVPENTTIKNISFRPGAEIGSQDKLTCNKAFVQYDLSSRERWHMLSIPLQEVYHGDFTFGGYPKVYLDTLAIDDGGGAQWNRINKMDRKFAAGDGFIYWVSETKTADNKGLQSDNNLLELPYFENDANTVHPLHKWDAESAQSTFEYYTLSGDDYIGSGDTETVPRTDAAYKLAGPTVDKELHFGTDNTYNSSFALVGNPFMSSIDFSAFASANSSVIKDNYQVYTGNGYAGYHPDGKWGVTFENEVDESQYIAPLQSFIVETASAESEEGTVTFNLATVTAEAIGKGALRTSEAVSDKLEISAATEEADAPVVIAFIANREDGQATLGSRDARKIPQEVNELPDIYTLKESGNGTVAVGANIINSDNCLIPIGLATSYQGNIQLTIKGMDSYNADVHFIDRSANVSEVDITGRNEYTCTINHTGDQPVEDRFFIQLSPKTITGWKDASVASLNIHARNNEVLVVSAASDPVRKILLYDLQGKLLDTRNPDASIYTLRNDRRLTAGVYALKVITNKEVKSVKIILK
jgi:hypothetical protein